MERAPKRERCQSCGRKAPILIHKAWSRYGYRRLCVRCCELGPEIPMSQAAAALAKLESGRPRPPAA